MKKICVLLLLFVLMGCEKTNVFVSTSGRLKDIKEVNTVSSDIVTSLNNFAFNMYDELSKNTNNMFISPTSIYLAMGMVYNGANGDTQEEMANVLNIGNMSLKDFNQLSRDLQYLILGYKNTKIELANSIWIRDTFSESIKNDFINNNKDYFGAMISALDFNNSSSKNIINDWVSKNTKGKIKDAIEGKIDSSTIMILINTIYFKAAWENQFDDAYTIRDNFNGKNGVENVDIMRQTKTFKYTENDLMQAILLPYEDSKTSMFIILPKGNLKDLNLSNDNFMNVIDEMNNKSSYVALSMPKIKMDYSVKLNEILAKLGMPSAFNKADFSKMTDEDVLISDVTHKTFLNIDENGTEAAAMTKVDMDLTSVMEDKPKEMNINRPFMFGIIDNSSKAILFLGHIYDVKE
jgi:serpin B